MQAEMMKGKIMADGLDEEILLYVALPNPPYENMLTIKHICPKRTKTWNTSLPWPYDIAIASIELSKPDAVEEINEKYLERYTLKCISTESQYLSECTVDKREDAYIKCTLDKILTDDEKNYLDIQLVLAVGRTLDRCKLTW